MVMPYRGFSVKYYSFSAIQMVKDRIDELLLARPLFRRERDDDLIIAQIQRFADLGKIRFHLTSSAVGLCRASTICTPR